MTDTCTGSHFGFKVWRLSTSPLQFGFKLACQLMCTGLIKNVIRGISKLQHCHECVDCVVVSNHTARFLVHSICLPADVIACEAISGLSSPFLNTAKSEAREGLGTRLCILFAVYTSQPVAKTMPFATSTDSYSRFQSLVTSSCLWSIWTLYQQNWRKEELSVLNGCVLWRASLQEWLFYYQEKAGNPGTARDTCTPRHCKDENFGKKLCVVGEPGYIDE